MDLLLHLVKQQEVSVHEIRIAAILEDFLKHLAVLEQLMEIKSRELLPTEAVELEEELDPRDDLIRRLLEYKRYRDLARELDTRADTRSRQAPLVLSLPSHLQDQDEDDLLDIGNVQIWDLTAAFSKLLDEIGQQATLHVEVQKRDVGYYTRRLLDRFKQKREVQFTEIFDVTEGRYGLIGTLIALLEMMKQGYLRAHQEQCFGEIHLAYKGGEDVSADQILAGIEAEEERQRQRDAELAENAGEAAVPPPVAVESESDSESDSESESDAESDTDADTDLESDAAVESELPPDGDAPADEAGASAN
jgi:segregation and condensation protein A